MKTLCSIFFVALPLLVQANEEAWFAANLRTLSGAVQSDRSDGSGDTEISLQSLLTYGDALAVVREYEKAIAQYEAALVLQQDVFHGLDGDDIVPHLLKRIDILTRMGTVFLDANQNRRALRILRQALSLASWGVPGDHEIVRDLRTVHSMAVAHTLLIEEAGALYEKLYESALKVYPEDHPMLGRILAQWVVLDVSFDRHAAAIERATRRTEVVQNAYGEKHPYLADSYAMLASLQYAHGDRTIVEDLLKKVLGIRHAAFGEDHPLSVKARKNIESLQHNQITIDY